MNKTWIISLPGIVCATLLLLGTACAGPAVTHPASADAFLRGVYSHYTANRQPPDIGSDAAAGIYTPALLSLLRKDRAALAGEAGVLDADPICACQDAAITQLSVTTKAAGPDKAIATAQFTNLGARESIHLTLRRTAAGWRIDDIHIPQVGSLQQALRQEIRDATAPDHPA